MMASPPFTYYYTIESRLMREHLWQDIPGVPVMVVATSCYDRRQARLRAWPVPAHCRPLAADSGGFTAARSGGYPFSAQEYVAWLAAIRPDWAATMDLPCGLADDDTVRTRQAFTLRMAAHLLALAESWAWMPVVQGRTVAQYTQHARAYRTGGMQQPYMAIGGLFGRTDMPAINAVIHAVREELPDTCFHLFGLKLAVLGQREALPTCVASADSAAWNGRFGRDHETFRAARAALGVSQSQTEISWALPRYKAKIDRALGRSKQLSLFFPEEE